VVSMVFRGGVWPLILPSRAVGRANAGYIARSARTAMLDVLAEDYMRTARAKGVATGPMLLKHALKNAGVPIVTVIGIGVALLIGVEVITGTPFNLACVGLMVCAAFTTPNCPGFLWLSQVINGV